MFKRIGDVLLDGVCVVVGSAALGAAWVLVKLRRKEGEQDGPYAVVPLLLAPIIALDFLRLRRIRVPALDLDAVFRSLGDLNDEDRALVAHMVAREYRRPEVREDALRFERRSHPVSPDAPERHLWSTRVPKDSIGALLATPWGWLRGDLGPLRIEAVLPEIVVDEVGEPRRQLSALVAVGDRRFLLRHVLHRDDASLALPVTADRERVTAAAADLARELTARKESALVTRFDGEGQWLTPLLDALVPAPESGSVLVWLLAHQAEWATIDCGHLRMTLSDIEIDRSFAGFGRVRATQRIDRALDGAIVDTTEVAFTDAVDARVLLAAADQVAAVPAAVARYRERKQREPQPEDLRFGGLEPGTVRMLADIASGEAYAPDCVPPVSEASIAAGARLLAEADPAELDHEDLGVGEALFAFAFGEYRIYLCANAELGTSRGAIVLAHRGEPPPIVVRSQDGLDAGFPVDGSSTHFAAFHRWLVRSLERRGGNADAVGWLQEPAGLLDELHPRDRGEARPWLFIAAVPWVELDDALLARHEHEVRVYHGFLRAAIDPEFDPRWDPRAEVLAARAAAADDQFL